MRKRSLILLVAVMLAFALAGGAFAAQFQADMTMDGMGQKVTGKVYVKGELMRQEINTPLGKSITIIDGVKDTTYVLMPNEKMYMEMSNEQLVFAESETIEEKLGDEADVRKVGTETIEGYKCDKYEVKYKDTAMGESAMWFSQKLNYPLKGITKTSEGTMTFTYTNIKEGSVDAGLFVIPPGYKKFSY
ncbi:MAG: DUF4412 domain-containing protein [Thermovirgaceae bacterium]|nr:DUF4412 domain-containing protein [Thermovirgaceae bacterium]